MYKTYNILVQKLKNRMLIFVSLISSELFLANEISSLAFGANFNGTRYDTLWILLFFFIEIDEIYRISYSENMEWFFYKLMNNDVHQIVERWTFWTNFCFSHHDRNDFTNMRQFVELEKYHKRKIKSIVRIIFFK